MTKPKKDHYATLGVKPEATPAELKRARRKKAATLHPDKLGGDQQAMSEVNHAFDVLADPARRLLYDKTGEDHIASPEVRARELVLQSFQDALQKDAPLILKHAKKFIEDAKGNIAKAKADGQRALKELRKMRDKIKTKGPINGFHLVVDKNLQSIEQRLASMDLDIEMCDAALKELEGYSSDEKHVVEYKTIQWGTSASTGGSW